MKLADGYVLVERPNATLRVAVLHHAGGSALSYLPLAQRLPVSCEPCLLDLPGRGSLDTLPPAPDFATAIEQTLPTMTAIVDRPTVVVGHSLGALVAHSLVASLPTPQRTQVKAVVVSAFQSPQDAAQAATHPGSPFQVRTRESVLGDLRELGGTPAEIFDDPEWLAETITLFGLDLHLVDTYHPPPAPVDADYHVWFGHDDSRLATEKLAGWAAATTKPVVTREFRGGHFYLTEVEQAANALAGLVSRLA
ncbi:thioesterase II family protein [Actinocrispum wychmicini]|uniref:Surfactin synthase thioesterase subunit n=1 Tax=Actinocrispum wychmicini TaxID=1213861 RepID=A0A4R2JI14_9PSEU|nr:alpha/beta fold hydrolase [Actinocrispum wychmicini]TCO59531.1 surfactin synthase thioesterase subunit [Actinocrispum wychmicini]